SPPCRRRRPSGRRPRRGSIRRALPTAIHWRRTFGSSWRDVGLRFDLDFVVADEPGDGDEGVGGTHRAEIAAVDTRDGLGARGVADVDARAHHVLELAAARLDGGADLVEEVDGRSFTIAGTHHGALAVRRGGSADQDARAAAYGARVARDRLPAGAGIDGPPLGPRVARSRLEYPRQSRQVVAQIARGGEKRRPAGFVPTIPPHPP